MKSIGQRKKGRKRIEKRRTRSYASVWLTKMVSPPVCSPESHAEKRDRYELTGKRGEGEETYRRSGQGKEEGDARRLQLSRMVLVPLEGRDTRHLLRGLVSTG